MKRITFLLMFLVCIGLASATVTKVNPVEDITVQNDDSEYQSQYHKTGWDSSSNPYYVYMKFDSSSFVGQHINSAELCLYHEGDAGSHETDQDLKEYYHLNKMPSQSWTEYSCSIYYSSCASPGDQIGTWIAESFGPDDGQYWVCMDVADYVEETMTDNISFYMDRTTNFGGEPDDCFFYSTYYATSTYHPYLEVNHVVDDYPAISISSPVSQTYAWNVDSADINYSASDDYGVSAVWYNLSTNSTLVMLAGNLANVYFGFGTKTIYVCVNDTQDKITCDSETFTMREDTDAPLVIIVSPLNQSYDYNIDSADLNYSVDEVTLDSVWYNFSHDAAPVPLSGNLSDLYFGFGNFTLFVCANDSKNVIGCDNVSFEMKESFGILNPFMYIEGIPVWNHSGLFSDSEIAIFTEELNSVLDNCAADEEGYCNISLNFSSDFAGSLDLTDLEVTYYSVSGNKTFYVKDSSGDNKASFDDDGNLELKGDCSVGTCDDISSALFVVKNSGDDAVAYIDTNGSLCLETGDCSGQSVNCPAPANAFVIRDVSDVDVAYIDSMGDLCLTGSLIESGNP